MAKEIDTFEIVIEFSPSEGDPARIFKTMSGLIDSFKEIDHHLTASIDTSLEATLLLENVENGSLKARFRNFVEGVPDEALQDGDWKKILGHFLLRSKKTILEWCNERDKISDRESVKALEGELVKIAEQTNIKTLPAYSPISSETLLSDIRNVQESLEPLTENDRAIYQYGSESIEFNRDLEISNEIVREVLTREIVKSSCERIIKVKKPDYLGQSMWAFVNDGRTIEAKITDDSWLRKFQRRSFDVKPGDSVRVVLYEEISYGYEGEIVHRHYEIEKVYEVIKPPKQGGMGF